MQTVVIEVDAKRYVGLSFSGKAHYIRLTNYEAPEKSSIYIPVSVAESVEEADGLVRFTVKKWWIDNNKTIKGIWKVKDVIDRHPERIRIVNESKPNKFADEEIENLMWTHVSLLNWEGNPDYERIRKELKKVYSAGFIADLKAFCTIKQEELKNRFESDWLSSIPVSDDGWGDLTAECVARGQDFYDNGINVEKLTHMATHMLYTENFMYSFL